MDLDAIRDIARNLRGAQGLRRIPVALVFAAMIWPASRHSDRIELLEDVQRAAVILGALALGYSIGRYYDTRFGAVRPPVGDARKYSDGCFVPVLVGFSASLALSAVVFLLHQVSLEQPRLRDAIWTVIYACLVLGFGRTTNGGWRPHALIFAAAILAVPFMPQPWPQFAQQAIALLVASGIAVGGLIDHRDYVRRWPAVASPQDATT